MKFKKGDTIFIHNVNNLTISRDIIETSSLKEFIGLKFTIEKTWENFSNVKPYYTLYDPEDLNKNYINKEVNRYYWRDEHFFTVNENEI